MPTRECTILYYYTEDSDNDVFLSPYLFAVDRQNNYVYISYHNEIIDIYIPNMNHIVELAG